MSLRLLLDEDIQRKLLVELLTRAGHDVKTVNDAGLVRQEDFKVFRYAIEDNRIIMTHNCKDFIFLHEQAVKKNLEHSGILGVYRHNNPSKDMSLKAIIKAIYNLEISLCPCNNQFISLNNWNY